jgi:hypothetical protein
MADYTYPQTAITFGQRDGLTTGDPNKIVKGVDFDPEFQAIALSSSQKMENVDPSFTGTMTGGGIVEGGTY